MDSIAAVLGDIRSKGVQLWTDNGRLHYRAPAGALTQKEFEILEVHRARIIALLQRPVDPAEIPTRVVPRPRRDRAPLTYSQLAHWHLYNLSERRSVRHVNIAIRIQGHLNVELLRHSIAEVVRRHDALRSRIIVLDGNPTLSIGESGDCKLDIQDLTEVPEGVRAKEVERLIVAHALQPIDVLSDPLFAAWLFRLRAEEHVLLVAMEHMISDGRSKRILLQEVFTAYSQAVQGAPISLPEVPIQLGEYAVWQRYTQIPALEGRIAYWRARMAGCPGSRFPVDRDLLSDDRRGLGVVRFQIDQNFRVELRAWCRRQRTTLAMSACTAYVALLFRWCNLSDVVIRFQTDGRFSPKTASTIGYLAFPLYMRVLRLEDDRFVDLLRRVSEEHARALEHADYSYLEAQTPRPEFTRSTRFNWFSQGAETEYAPRDESESTITCSRIFPEVRAIEDFAMDDDPNIVFSETDNEIRGSVAFPLQRFAFSTMERFASNYLVVMRTLFRQPNSRVKDLPFA
jgi:hypothetical protein